MTYLSNSSECPSCGSEHKSRPFCTYENGVHCFSCGYTKTYDRSFSTMKIGDRTPNIPGLTGLKSRLADFCLENQMWLNKYFITAEDIKNHNVQETEDGALIFCTIQHDVVVHYQKRYNTIPRRILSYGPKTPSISSINSSTIALVEDFISYIRISKYIDVICLWGTKTSYEVLKGLLNYTKVLVWLDNDIEKETNSGQEAAKKICQMLQSIINYNNRRFGFGSKKFPEVTNIVTNGDPKSFSPSQLEEIIGVKHAIA